MAKAKVERSPEEVEDLVFRRVFQDATEWKDPTSKKVPEKPLKSRAILGRNNPPHHAFLAVELGGYRQYLASESRVPNGKEQISNRVYQEPVQQLETVFSGILLKEPPAVLRPSEVQTEQESIEILVTRLLLKSYYDIVRKNIQDSVPKAIMHFLVNHAKRELHNVFIRKLYRENLFEDMLQEREDISIKRKRCKELLKVFQQAAFTLEDLPLEFDFASKPAYSALDATGLPPRFVASSHGIYSNGESSYMGSPKNIKRRAFNFEQPSGNTSNLVGAAVNFVGNASGPSSAGMGYPIISA